MIQHFHPSPRAHQKGTCSLHFNKCSLQPVSLSPGAVRVQSLPMPAFGVSTYPETRSFRGPHGLGDSPQELLRIFQQELFRGPASRQRGLHAGAFRGGKQTTLHQVRGAISNTPIPEGSTMGASSGKLECLFIGTLRRK